VDELSGAAPTAILRNRLIEVSAAREN
jgi:hypothetical protein